MTSIKNVSLSKQEGFTTVELLVSMFIIAIIFVSSFQFFESYEVNTSELGEYESARFLAQSGIENERAEVLSGDKVTGTVFSNETYSNRIRFQTTVEKENVTTQFAFFDNRVDIYKLTSIVSWKEKKMEVFTYVSSR